LVAIVASGVALFAAGAALSRLTGRTPWVSGARMLVVAAVAASVTFGVGRLLYVSTTG
jgi:VIT1/CCC1 family predicted Fe2+/Mn2+ transporter